MNLIFSTFLITEEMQMRFGFSIIAPCTHSNKLKFSVYSVIRMEFLYLFQMGFWWHEFQDTVIFINEFRVFSGKFSSKFYREKNLWGFSGFECFLYLLSPYLEGTFLLISSETCVTPSVQKMYYLMFVRRSHLHNSMISLYWKSDTFFLFSNQR